MPSFEEILASASCPPPPPPREISPGADVMIQPTSLSPLSISLRRGWSPSSKGECWHASATASNDAGTSAPVTMGNPIDCIPVPEPPLEYGLAACFALALVLGRIKRKAP